MKIWRDNKLIEIIIIKRIGSYTQKNTQEGIEWKTIRCDKEKFIQILTMSDFNKNGPVVSDIFKDTINGVFKIL